MTNEHARPGVLSLIGWIVACLAAGAIGGLATGPAVAEWYPTLTKPPGNPPNWVFGPVWSVLYLLMAVAVWRVWRVRGWTDAGVRWFLLQLALNAIWSLLFFGARMPAVALVEIVLLWLAIAATLLKFWPVDRPAAALMIPYLLWVTFATYLNAGIVWLN